MKRLHATFWAVLGLLTAVLSQSLIGEDRVTYRPSGSSRPITVVGDIIDYTGRDLTLHAVGGSPQLIDADEITAVKTHYDPVHMAALEEYQAGRLTGALAKFIAASEREPREWVDREIAAWIVRCSLVLENQETALRYFREIIKSDPDTRHWGLAPLIWSPVIISEGLRGSLRSLLVSSRAGDRFLAASILLFDGTSGTLAERELNDLASDPNPRISRLARAQLWRIALANSEVTENILQSWREQIADLPESLRPGPQYLLARGYLHLGEPRLAAAEFLKLSILYTSHDALTARATLEAAEAIERTGLTQEANLLYRELLMRFSASPEAKIARDKL